MIPRVGRSGLWRLTISACSVALALGMASEARAQQNTAQSAPHAAAAKAAGSSDAASARISRIEEQLNDLQVSVGTLESLVKSKPSATLAEEAAQPQGQPAPQAAAGNDDLEARVKALETQIGAVTGQLEQLTQQFAALQTKLQSGTGASSGAGAGQQGSAAPDNRDRASSAPDSQAEQAAGFGSTSVTPGDDEQGANHGGNPQQLLPPGQDSGYATDANPGNEPPQGRTASLTPSGNAETLYNQGYGDLLQQDYAGAEAAFQQLVTAFPNDALAGKAQYWLGQSYYVRGEYKKAADAFLKGYRTYHASDKAADSLLGLGMSLAALGQKDAACESFDELTAKFPSAPARIRDEMADERQKAGC